jgi:hypothetical protein
MTCLSLLTLRLVKQVVGLLMKPCLAAAAHYEQVMVGVMAVEDTALMQVTAALVVIRAMVEMALH